MMKPSPRVTEATSDLARKPPPTRVEHQPKKNPTKKLLFLSKKKVGHHLSGKHKAIGPKNVLRLCIHDEYGTKALAKPAVILKSTLLLREVKLRTQRRILLWMYRVHKIRTWEAFKGNAKTMAQLHLTMDNAIDKYAAQRMQNGLFYIIADTHYFTHTVRSHLYGGDSGFLRDLWRKKRLERKMRRQTKQKMCSSLERVEESELSGRSLSSTIVAMLKLCGMRHTLGLLLVVVLASMILYL